MRFVALLLICAAMTACVEGTAAPPPAECGPPYPAGTPTVATVLCADPAGMQPASVVRVVDGDTLRAIVDGVEEPVRFYGIDTRERGEACFDEATRRTRELSGDEVLLVPDERNRDRNGRLLRYVYSPDGLSIDAALVAEGLAYAWRDDGALREELVELEDRAREAEVGCLWRR
jgi:endonuclease YncB( thermonuclease family)